MRRSVVRAALCIVAACVAVGGWGGAAFGLSTSKVVVFGDSLSDMGNIEDATFGLVAGSYYFDGRFSNGPVWVERLASDLGVGPLKASTSGGTNFAYGGGQTTGAGGVGGLFIHDLDEQMADFRASQTVDPHALYVVWAGANDLFDGETNVNAPIGRVKSTVDTLLSLGARRFLVPNLPILGKIPEYNRDPVTSASFNALSTQYNATFAGVMETLAAQRPDATFYRLDVGPIFSDAITHPSAWGLTNVMDAAAAGLTPGKVFYNTSKIAAHPEQYLFWDTIHPTASIHQILGDLANRLVAGMPGDFNTDGNVNAADLALVRAGFGAGSSFLRQGNGDGDADVDGLDFLAWQRGLGATLAKGPRAGATAVPEPGAVSLASLALLAFGLKRIRRGGDFLPRIARIFANGRGGRSHAKALRRKEGMGRNETGVEQAWLVRRPSVVTGFVKGGCSGARGPVHPAASSRGSRSASRRG